MYGSTPWLLGEPMRLRPKRYSCAVMPAACFEPLQAGIFSFHKTFLNQKGNEDAKEIRRNGIKRLKSTNY